jgi:hypothetical protein
MLFCCCLSVAASGCLFNRTSDGYAFNNPWSSQGGWFPGLKSGLAKPADSGRTAVDSRQLDTDRSVAAEKPELMPWRSRLKGRMNARVARGRESTASQETTAEMPAGVLPAKYSELQLPADVGRRTASARPDLVVD